MGHGRVEELALVVGAARTGAGAVIAGPSGVGKSRLLGDAVEWLADDGVAVHVVHTMILKVGGFF